MVDKSILKVGMTIYDRQPRWFDFDYHPQIIEKINENNTIEVFEEGYSPDGKRSTIKISHLYLEKGLIIH